MNCAQARELWHERLDGLSDSAAEAEVETHMSACAACRVWRGQMRQVAGALDELRVQTEQVGVNPSREREGVVISIDGPHVRPRRRPAAWWAFGRVAAGMVLMIAGGAYVYNNRTSTVDSGPTSIPAIDPLGLTTTARATMVLTGASAQQYISVRHETSSPNVHIFRLYRAYKRPDTETSDS